MTDVSMFEVLIAGLVIGAGLAAFGSGPSRRRERSASAPGADSRLAVFDGTVYAVGSVPSTCRNCSRRIAVWRAVSSSEWELVGGSPSDPAGDATDAVISASPAGLHIAWRERTRAAASARLEIRVARMSERRTWELVAPGSPLNVTATQHAGRPALAVAEGRLFVGWIEGGHVRVKHLDAATNRWQVAGTLGGMGVNAARGRALELALHAMGGRLFAAYIAPVAPCRDALRGMPRGTRSLYISEHRGGAWREQGSSAIASGSACHVAPATVDGQLAVAVEVEEQRGQSSIHIALLDQATGGISLPGRCVWLNVAPVLGRRPALLSLDAAVEPQTYLAFEQGWPEDGPDGEIGLVEYGTRSRAARTPAGMVPPERHRAWSTVCRDVPGGSAGRRPILLRAADGGVLLGVVVADARGRERRVLVTLARATDCADRVEIAETRRG